MKRALFVFLLSFSYPLWGSPDNLTFIFLSEQKVSLHWGIEELGKLAENGYPDEAYKNCKPMGEGCFHPQYGIMPPKDAEMKEKSKPLIDKEKINPYKTLNVRETQLVECREGHYFDVYCGEEKKENPKKKSKYEVWFDISSSIRRVDYSKDLEHCERRLFAEKMGRLCGTEFRVQGYYTAKKEIMDYGNLCQYRGSNDTDRLIRWIENANVEKLVVITDIEEVGPQLKGFIAKHGAKTYGIGTKEIFSADLVDMSEKLFPDCSEGS